MLPSPSSSPRPILEDCTNGALRTPFHTNASLPFPTPPEDRILKRRAAPLNSGVKKRVKLSFDNDSNSSESDSDSCMHKEDPSRGARSRRHTSYQRIVRSAMMGTSGAQVQLPTRAILQSFVSSHKSDIFKCQSTDVDAYLTPPYACSYTHGAKQGRTPILAVATEQGSVHVLNTSRRRDWDFEPPRVILQIHNNGIFDVKWNMDDTLLATCSGDQSTRITCASTSKLVHVLRGHTSTVKCVAWDPANQNLLSTGGRDGTICLWDIRVAGDKTQDGHSILSPVTKVLKAHDTPSQSKGSVKAKRGKAAPTSRSVTNLLYPEVGTYGLISSGSFDGILRYWDLRLPTNVRKTKTKQKPLVSLYASPIDPTTLHGSRRPRGIISLVGGTGPTAGTIFALGADSRVHTYALPSLAAQISGFTHKNMQTNSFYVGLALSPCGRWLASGGTGAQGSNFLFDVSDAARPLRNLQPNKGVELRGQLGEAGAVDWAADALATCADDGTVRLWRPDIETYRVCTEKPEDMAWDWSWSVGES